MKDSPLRLGLTLMIIAGIMGLILGASYVLTKDTIAAEKEAADKAAYEAVLPEGASMEQLEEAEIPAEYAKKGVLAAYRAGDGAVMQVVNIGFGGNVKIAVGIGSDGTVSGVTVVEHGESAGLGANAANPEFTDQYIGMSGEIGVSKSDPSASEIKAISGATITSKCVTTSVNTALAFYEAVLKGGN